MASMHQLSCTLFTITDTTQKLLILPVVVVVGGEVLLQFHGFLVLLMADLCCRKKRRTQRSENMDVVASVSLYAIWLLLPQ
jgi:hypothetical protein